jgi:hypothetical protein
MAGVFALALVQPAQAIPDDPAPASVLGIEAAALTPAHLSLIDEAGAGWVRRNALLWSEVEPREGGRNWAAVAGLEQELRDAARTGLKTILVVRGTPPWAQKLPGVSCGPVREDKLAAFGRFMRDVAERYRSDAFAVNHFEIGNEPDIDSKLVAPDNIFGCWGDEADAYYGGGYYSRALRAVYAPIKEANPRAQVLIGGLLLDCNPSRPVGKDSCRAGRFLEGVLKAGGGAHFDIVSVHAYDFWTGKAGGYANDKWRTSSATTGPSIIAKTAFIRQLLKRYGLVKPIMNTESALLCWDCKTLPDDYIRTRAYFAAQSYMVAKAEKLSANIWYSLEGWFGTSLLTSTGEGNETWRALAATHARMAGATGIRTFVSRHKARVYEYTQNGRRAWMVWSSTGRPVPLALPASPAKVTDVFGDPLDAGPRLMVDAMPLHIQW